MGDMDLLKILCDMARSGGGGAFSKEFMRQVADEIERLRRLAENWNSDLTVREQQVERLQRELAEARELLRAVLYWYWNANSTGMAVETLDRIDAFLDATAAPKEGER